MAEENKQMESQLVVARDSKAAVLARLGIADDGSQDFTKLIRENFKKQGFTGKDLRIAVNNVLKGEDYNAFVDAEMGACERAGWLKKVRYGKPNKEGVVTQKTFIYVMPPAPKVTKISLAAAEEVRRLVGEDAYQILVKNNAINTPKGSEEKPIEVEATVTQEAPAVETPVAS